MNFKTILAHESDLFLTLTINRPEHQNSINYALLEELHKALDDIEKKSPCRIVILKGNVEFFCSGMDLKNVALGGPEMIKAWTKLYMQTLKRFVTSSKIIVSHIQGKVLAGGVGLVAASDWVIATEEAHFKLTESFWGLIPAMVAPYLIRRIGFQHAYAMALTAKSISASNARNIGLVDELTPYLDDASQELLKRLEKNTTEATKNIKEYFRKMWIINDVVEEEAINETTMRLQNPKVQETIRNFVEHGILPWE